MRLQGLFVAGSVLFAAKVTHGSQCSVMLESLKEGAKALEVKLTQCKESLSESKSSLAESQKSLKHLQETTHLEMNELEDLRNRARTVEDGLTDKEMDLENLRKKAIGLEKNVTQLVRLGQTYRNKNKQLKGEVESALTLLEDERETTSTQKKELEKKEAEIINLQKQVEELHQTRAVKEMEAAKSALEQLQKQHKELQASKADVDNTLEEATEALESKTKEVERLKEKLELKEKDHEDLAEKHAELENERDDLKEQNDKLSEELAQLKSMLADEHRKVEELDSEKSSVESKVDELSAKQRAAAEESERLKLLFEQYKEKVDDPALIDYFMKKAEWIKHPHLEGVDHAYEKAAKLIGPKLQPTHEALLEMQELLKASENRLIGVVGEDSKLSPLVSGLLTYGILLFPLGLTLLLLVRLKRCITLTKATMLMTLYNAIFSGTLFVASFLIESEEPLRAFREENESAFEFLQIMIPLYYCFYLMCVVLLALKYTLLMRCKCSVRVVLMGVIPCATMYHYYLSVWEKAMRDEPPVISRDEWGYYALAFGVLFCLITCMAPQSKSESNGLRDATLPLLSGKHKHGYLVEAKEIEKEEESHVINLNAEVRSPEDLMSSAKETAEMVREKAEEFAESISSGGKKKKSSKEKKSKKKKVSRSKSSDEASSDLENLEDRKVD